MPQASSDRRAKLQDVLLPLLGGLVAAASPYAGRGVMAAANIADRRRQNRLEDQQTAQQQAAAEQAAAAERVAQAEERQRRQTLASALLATLPPQGANPQADALRAAVGYDPTRAAQPVAGWLEGQQAQAAESAAAKAKAGQNDTLLQAIQGALYPHQTDPRAQLVAGAARINPAGAVSAAEGYLADLEREKRAAAGAGSQSPSLEQALAAMGGLDLAPGQRIELPIQGGGRLTAAGQDPPKPPATKPPDAEQLRKDLAKHLQDLREIQKEMEKTTDLGPTLERVAMAREARLHRAAIADLEAQLSGQAAAPVPAPPGAAATAAPAPPATQQSAQGKSEAPASLTVYVRDRASGKLRPATAEELPAAGVSP
jgi:hypothetical protein